MHLHHTKRKLQIQGGALMPDKTRSPIWFVQNVISTRFQELAKSKAFDVSNFNKTVREQLTIQSRNSPSSCSSCHIQFTGRSLPEICWQCSKYHHKKCLQSNQHACHKHGSVIAPGSSFLAPNAVSVTISAPDPTLSHIKASHTSNRTSVLQPEDQLIQQIPHIHQTATTTLEPSLQQAPTAIFTPSVSLAYVTPLSSASPMP